MALPITFATLTPPQGLSDFDTQFAAVAALGAIPCAASGNNTIALTPFPNCPTITSYPDLQPSFVFVAAGTNTVAPTINVSGVGARGCTKWNGNTGISAGDLVAGQIYRATPLQALFSGAGGFDLSCIGSSLVLSAIQFFIDGGGVAITPGLKVWVRIPFPFQITAWHVLSDQTGSCVLDVWDNGHAFPTSSIIGAGNKPTLSSAQIADANVSGWTSTVLSQGDYVGVDVVSATTVTKIFMDLAGQRL
jgi:hypothetical protein